MHQRAQKIGGYQELQKSPKSSEIESWLSKWEEVNSECLEANILAVKDDDDPVEDFVNACEHVNPEFHQYWINRLEDPDIASQITLHKIIEAFRTSRRRMSKRELNKDISFASFQGRGQDQRNTNKQPKDKDKKKKTEKTCPCGQKHFFKDCPYVNHSIRPKNWKPDHEVEETFKRACENPRFNTAYTEACKKFALKADNDEKTEREDPNFVDFSGATKLIDSSNGLKSIDDYDLVQAFFKKSWVYDSGTTSHICNDRSRFTDFVPIDATVEVGDTRTKILGIGKVMIQPTLPTDKRLWPRITLLETLYSPGFHTNLVSMQRLEKVGLYWNLRKGILETKDMKPLCRIDTRFKTYSRFHSTTVKKNY